MWERLFSFWRWVVIRRILIVINIIAAAFQFVQSLFETTWLEIFTIPLYINVTWVTLFLFGVYEFMEMRGKWISLNEKLPIVSISNSFGLEKFPLIKRGIRPKDKAPFGINPTGNIHLSPEAIRHSLSSTSGGDYIFETISKVGDKNIVDYEIYFEEGDVAERYYISFTNNAGNYMGVEDTQELHVEMIYFDNNGNQILRHERPRWSRAYKADAPPPPMRLLSSGDREDLYLIIKKAKNKTIYAFGRDSYRDGGDLMPKKMNLGSPPIYIYISIQASNVRKIEKWIKVVSKKRNKVDLKFELPNWNKHNKEE